MRQVGLASLGRVCVTDQGRTAASMQACSAVIQHKQRLHKVVVCQQGCLQAQKGFSFIFLLEEILVSQNMVESQAYDFELAMNKGETLVSCKPGYASLVLVGMLWLLV